MATEVGGLRERSLKVRHAVITSMAVVTPTAAIFFLTIPAAGNAGKAMPFAFLLAFVAVLLIVNAIARFTQHVSHAGSFYAFVGSSLGPRAGFLTGWLFLAFYPLVQVFSLVIFGAFVEQIISQHGGPDIHWWIITLVGLVFIWGLSVLGIKLSIRTDLAFLVFEGLVLGALALTILFRTKHGVWHPETFNPRNAPTGASGIALAAVFGIQCFTGFEAASYLGEEAQQPRRTIPRGMLITTVLAGIIYVVFAYIATIGWGPDKMGAYASNPAPWDVLGTQYWNSSATILVDLAAAIAALAGGMASQNGAARMIYALGRERLLPAVFGHTNRRFGTPDIALTTLLAAAIAIGLGLGFGYDPLSAFALLGLVVTFSALGVYFAAQLACIFFFARRGTLHWLWHVAVPIGAMAVIGYLFYETVTPKQPHPLNLGIWIALAWAFAGVIVTALVSAAAPQRFARMSKILGEDEPGELLTEEGTSTAAPQA